MGFNSAFKGLKEIGWEDVDWSDLAQENDQGRAIVNLVTNLRGSIICGEFLDPKRI
jgi:hypothetical protein